MVTYKHVIPHREWGKSKTQPDLNLTVKQLFERFAKGLPVQQSQNQGVYLGDENDVDMEKVSRLPVIDKADMADEVAAQVSELQTKAEQIQAERREAQKRKAEEAAKAKQQPPDQAAKA